jgi:hypothetical protein
MRKKHGSYALIILLILAGLTASAQETIVKSPDGAIVFTFLLKTGKTSFTISRSNQTVIDPSPLVFLINNEIITEQVIAGAVNKYAVNEAYSWLGAHSVANNPCRITH